MSRYPQILTREAALDRQLTAEMAVEAEQEQRNAMVPIANGFATFAIFGLPIIVFGGVVLINLRWPL